MTTGEPRPDEAADAAEFVDLLRRLKDRSGLTYRQLEQRAAAAGDVLARSTAADVLRRSTLPRPEVLAAFVRACGAEDQVEAWLRARHRLAVGTYAPPSPAPGLPPADGGTPERTPADSGAPDQAATGTGPGRADAGRPRWFARPAPLALLVVGVLLAVLGVGFWVQQPDDEQRKAAQLTDPTGAAGGTSTTRAGSASGTPGSDTGAARTPDEGRSQIRPARTPQLCVTEGRDRTGRYPKEIAAQRPCADATPPDTYLEVAADGLYFVKWVHPVHGPGCLTIRDEDPGRNLLEPWDDCDRTNVRQLFRFEPTGSAPTSYRIRPTRTELCVGLRDDDTEVSAEAVVEPCTNGADQVFLVDALPEG